MHRLLINNLFRLSNIKNNPYDLLGLPNSATEEDIKSAYYKLAKQYHPDLKPEYSDKFKEINEAYNILKDPIKRTDYDHLLNLSKDKQNVSEVHRSYYNTNFHYGYTKKTRQQEGPRYESNPFAHEYQKRFSNEFTRNIFRADNQARRGKDIRNKSNTVRNITIGFFGCFLIFFSAEVMVKIYAFNRLQQKSIIYERLDPREESRGLVD